MPNRVGYGFVKESFAKIRWQYKYTWIERQRQKEGGSREGKQKAVAEKRVLLWQQYVWYLCGIISFCQPYFSSTFIFVFLFFIFPLFYTNTNVQALVIACLKKSIVFLDDINPLCLCIMVNAPSNPDLTPKKPGSALYI